jgi:Tol biopolymer transport system component
LGSQIAEALAAAHVGGVVHRDIKPENLMVRPDGYVKVLDFGAAAQIGTGDDLAGIPIGTLGYMSPEQIQGKPLTGASDVFSLGAVLTELASGRHPFLQDTAALTSKAIQTSEPGWLTANECKIAEPLGSLLRSMLAKEPERRPSAVMVAARLAAIAGKGGPRRVISRRAVVAGGPLLLATGVLSYRFLLRQTARPARAALPRTALASLPGEETAPAFSPDASQIAFVFRGNHDWNSHLYRKVLATGAVSRFTSDAAAESNPAWSPDGKQIAYLRGDGGRFSLMVMPASGGAQRKIGEIVDYEHAYALMTWHPSGRSLIASDAPSEGRLDLALFSISAETGERRKLTDPPAGRSDIMPRFSSDGRRLAFVRMAENGLADLFTMNATGINSRETLPKRLSLDIEFITGLSWTPDGRELVFAIEQQDAYHVYDMVREQYGQVPGGLYHLWRQSSNGGRPALIEGIAEQPRDLAVAPVGSRLAYQTASVLDVNLWRYPTSPSHEAPVQLIASAAEDIDPRYSPDGSTIAFSSDRSGLGQLWTSNSDGSNLQQLTFFGPGQGVTGSPNWSPDGRQIAFDTRFPRSVSTIMVISSEGGEPRRPTGPGPIEQLPTWSHDGHWIYFSSDRTGRSEIWKAPATGGEPVRVTSSGGFEVFASLDGQYLYYTKGRETAGMWRMPVKGGPETFLPELKPVMRHRYWCGARDGIYFLDLSGEPLLKFYSFATGRVRTLVPAPMPPVPRNRGLTVSPDGRYFLYMQYDVRRSAIMLVDGFR